MLLSSYVLLDLHGTFGGQNTFDNCGEVNSDPQLWKNTEYQDRTVKLWEGIANHYKGNPAVAGYDLLNEPDRVGKDQLNAFYNRLYKAIRAIDSDHMIYMEAAWDWNQLYAPSVYGWTNVVYEMHYYAMATGESTNWNVKNNLIDNLWEKFKKVQLADGTIALQAMANNKYVCTDVNNGAVLYANRDSVGGAWEAFTITAQ